MSDIINDINIRHNSAIRYWPDKEDTWQTPLETKERGAGDCEDFAIAKYFDLLDKNLDELFICYVMHKRLGAHMVCVADGLVLDNLNSDLRPLDGHEDLIPVWAFNVNSAFIFKNGERPEFPVTNIRKWQKLLNKVEAGG